LAPGSSLRNQYFSVRGGHRLRCWVDAGKCHDPTVTSICVPRARARTRATLGALKNKMLLRRWRARRGAVRPWAWAGRRCAPPTFGSCFGALAGPLLPAAGTATGTAAPAPSSLAFLSAVGGARTGRHGGASAVRSTMSSSESSSDSGRLLCAVTRVSASPLPSLDDTRCAVCTVLAPGSAGSQARPGARGGGCGPLGAVVHGTGRGGEGGRCVGTSMCRSALTIAAPQ
jgi:hypothetical protein